MTPKPSSQPSFVSASAVQGCSLVEVWWPAPGPVRLGIAALGERDGEDAECVDTLVDFAKAGGADELVEFGLSTAAHDPWPAVAVAGERAGDHLELGVPGLAGVDEIAADGNGVGEAGEGALDRFVRWEQLVQSGGDGKGRS